MVHVVVEGKGLTVREVVAVAREGGERIPVPPMPLEDCRGERVRGIASRARQPVYGVTTGFGKFADVVISPPRDAEALQRNLLLSHAAE